MKTLEEKARAYDKAIEKIKYVMEHGVQPVLTREDLQSIFPEIFESEDERMKKAIIHILYENYTDAAVIEGVEIAEIVAWLEKQVEKPQGKTALEAAKEEKSPAESLGSPEKYEEIVNECIYGEKKTVDEAIPKFKIGDFIANDYCFGKVIEITNDAYLLDTGQGIPFSCEHNAHLWTIKDAKDGDILCCESGWTCIFKAINSNNITFSSYCFMDNTGWFYKEGSESHTFEDSFIKAYHGNIHPATKEQRDTLMKAMTDAGYTFDFEKKELKKIEQKLANSAKTCKNDTLLDLLNKMPSCITVDGIDYHFVMKKTSYYIAYYKGNKEEYSGNAIFGVTAFSPIELLTAMLKKLKKEGLLE